MKKLAPIVQLTKSELSTLSSVLPDAEPQISGNAVIPVCEPDIGVKEKRYVRQAVESSWISSAGDFVQKFETAFAHNISGTRYAYAVNSGTSALHLALAALGVGPGDEVIVPVFTMIATANAVIYCGATPIFIDSDPVTWNMDISAIESKITKRTKVIIPVHTYGQPVRMTDILKIAKKHSLWVVEDAAEAHGAIYKGKRAGSFGDVAAFSLYANKLMTTGEGGMVVTDNPHIAERVELLRNHAFTTERHFWHTMIGFGYKMTNLQAAVGLAQVERFAALFRSKQRHAALYRSLLAGVPGITLPTELPDSIHSYWMFGILVDEDRFGMSKNALRNALARRGIETRSFFIPIHVQPAYFRSYGHLSFPTATALCREGLYLPSSTTLSADDIVRICESLIDIRRSTGAAE